jgi:hypothetical protein
MRTDYRHFLLAAIALTCFVPLPAQTVEIGDSSFTLTFSATLHKPEQPALLASIPDVLDVKAYMRDADDNDMRLNYCNFRMPDGSLPVMEATLYLNSTQHPDWNRMIIGFPLSCRKMQNSESIIQTVTDVIGELTKGCSGCQGIGNGLKKSRLLCKAFEEQFQIRLHLSHIQEETAFGACVCIEKLSKKILKNYVKNQFSFNPYGVSRLLFKRSFKHQC